MSIRYAKSTKQPHAIITAKNADEYKAIISAIYDVQDGKPDMYVIDKKNIDTFKIWVTVDNNADYNYFKCIVNLMFPHYL